MTAGQELHYRPPPPTAAPTTVSTQSRFRTELQEEEDSSYEPAPPACGAKPTPGVFVCVDDFNSIATLIC